MRVRLPEIELRGKLDGDRLSDPATLHAAHVAGGAPAPLRGRLERIDIRAEEGIVVELRDGPELYFGNAKRVRAKWIAATRILADPEAAGASYIDVRLPGRPAAGGLPAETLAPVAPAGSADLAPPTGTAPTATGVDPATEQLAPAGDNRRRNRADDGHPAGRTDRSAHPPSQPPLLPIPPGLEALRRLPDNPHPLVELQGNPRPTIECLPAGFLARTIDTSLELRLQCGVCGGRKPSTIT